MEDDWIIEKLFSHSSDPSRAEYKGNLIVRSDRFSLDGCDEFSVIFESADSDWPQAVRLETDIPIKINGHRGILFTLWSDTAPTAVPVHCGDGAKEVWVSNAWDPTGDREPEVWTGCGAMMTEHLESGRRYRCNDGFPNAEFDDLVFRLERVP